MHKSGFHNPLQLLLGTVLDEIDHILFRFLVEALGHVGRIGNRQLQEVSQLLL